MYTPPVNNSWNEFKGNWKNVTKGGIKYLVNNNLKALPALYNRLAFAMLKKSVTNVYKTPEGFYLENNREMLSHGQIFIEENLSWPPMFRNISVGPTVESTDIHVLDVGSNVGFFSQWLGSKIPNLTYHLFDPVESHNLRAAQLNWGSGDSILKGPCSKQFILLNTVAVGAEDKDEVTFNVGELVTKNTPRTTLAQVKVSQITIDSYNKNTPYRFYLCLKIDTDGMNLEVLQGAVNTLPFVKWILIEKESEHQLVHQFLKKHRFDFQGMTSSSDMVYLNSNAENNCISSRQIFKQLELPNLNLESKSDGVD
jgi:FkbM family methyltransferase